MRTAISFASPAEIETELLVALAADAQTPNGSDSKPRPTLLTAEAAVLAATASVLSTGEFKAGANETVLLHAPSGLAAKRLLIVGLGKLSRVTVHKVCNTAGTAVRFAEEPRGIREIVLTLPRDFSEGCPTPRPPQAQPSKVPSSAISTPTPTAAIVKISKHPVVQPHRSQRCRHGPSSSLLSRRRHRWRKPELSRSLVNEPGNKLTPPSLAAARGDGARKSACVCEVHSPRNCTSSRWALSGASRRARRAPGADRSALRAGGREGRPVLGLVGKGITFDTGGISIKPADNMEKMKYDMAGGAAMSAPCAPSRC